jgi:hypothetical protein
LPYTSGEPEKDETQWHQVIAADVLSSFLDASTRSPSIHFDEMDFKETGRQVVSWINLVHDREE